MGTFAGLFCNNKGGIPDSKKKEFVERIETIFQAGGMMEVEWIQLYGKKIATIRKAKMREDGMDFYYNYFEDSCWENAGFDVEDCHVWSEKIGWSYFHKAVVAAYVLEELYTDGVAVAWVDGEPVTSWGYVAWINYLFDEIYHVKNFDPWKLFEAYQIMGAERVQRIRWSDFGHIGYAFIGGCEIYAVLHDTKKALEVFGAKQKEKIEEQALEGMKLLLGFLVKYKRDSKLDKDEQVQKLMEAICSYYETNDNENVLLNADDEDIASLLTCLRITDAPAFMVKAISEVYEKDFWDLWAEVQNVAERKATKLFGKEGYYVVPVPTKDFFGQSPDDMIPYWEENCDFEFSKELWEWFEALKSQFDNMINAELGIKNPLEYILQLMEEADENYYHIYTFYDFFEECLENLGDKRYQVLWKLYEEMLRDPELKKAGDVIFVPEGPEYEKVGLHYLGEQPKRRLMHSWDITDWDKRNNKARVTFRRYMALVANKPLRCKVFGF